MEYFNAKYNLHAKGKEVTKIEEEYFLKVSLTQIFEANKNKIQNSKKIEFNLPITKKDYVKLEKHFKKNKCPLDLEGIIDIHNLPF